MTDDELEQRLRAWYHAEVPEGETAPLSLRTGLTAITAIEPDPVGRSRRRRGMTLLAVAALLAMGGAIAAGSGLVRLLSVVPSPPTLPAPSSAIVPAPSSTAAAPSSTPSPDASIPPAGPFAASQDTFRGLDQFLLAPDDAGWVTTSAAMYHTADMGATWVDVRPPGWSTTAATSVIDGQTMYAASDGVPMTIAATHDGGVSWTEATIDDPSIGSGPFLSFQTPSKGFATFFAAGSDRALIVYRTTDGGATWAGPESGAVPVIEASMGKLDGRSGGTLFLTSGKFDNKPFDNDFVLSLDGGATWLKRTLPTGDQAPASRLKGISRVWLGEDGSIVMAISVDGAGFSIWSSDDDARSWRLVSALPREIADFDVDFISRTEWVAYAGDGSPVWSTVNGGAEWRKVATDPSASVRFADLSFASVDRGWAVEHCRDQDTSGGFCTGHVGESVLLRTVDGGRTWTPVVEAQAGPTPRPSGPVRPDDAAWATVGVMAGGKFGGHGPGLTATLLRDGTVLVVGGARGDGSAERYDPSTGRWTSAGTPLHPRLNHTATLLPDGRVLLAGGYYGGHDRATTEIYDPASNGWTAGAPMHTARERHQAIALLDGRVLVVGGIGDDSAVDVTAELYDPRTGTWSATGRPKAFRAAWTAPLVRLSDGRVLFAGGTNGNDQDQATAELYDPATGVWTATGSMVEARAGHTATLLGDGRVLVAGGARSYSGKALPTAEIFDPGTGTWSETGSMVEALADFSATLLPDGTVLVAGGSQPGDGVSIASTSAELFDPGTRTWRATATMAAARYGHSATLLPDGTVLVAGGHGTAAFDDLDSAEMYRPGGGSR
jgi:Galactose oxidase, central domain/Kelch motif